METEFIYWRHDTPVGVRVEEICGAEDRKGRVWELMARQVYCENGRETYRAIGHFESGAPYLEGCDNRISIAHTDGLFAVASLPRTPEVDLSLFSQRAALGIDVERLDREQVLKVRERFLSPEEMEMIPSTSLEANIVAWTCKEAMLKASMNSAIDIRGALRINRLPGLTANTIGSGSFTLPDGTCHEMELYSYPSENCCVTIAVSPKAAKYKKKG